MVILYESIKYAYGIVGILSLIALIVGCVFIWFALMGFTDFGIKYVRTWVLTLIMAALITLGILGIVLSTRPYYKVYLSDMSFEEFSKDYEVEKVEGLIITAYKKGEK